MFWECPAFEKASLSMKVPSLAPAICSCHLFDDVSPTNPRPAPAGTVEKDAAMIDPTKTDAVKIDTTGKDAATKASGVLTGTHDTAAFVLAGLNPWKLAFPAGSGKIFIRVAAWSSDSRIAFPCNLLWKKP